MSFNVGENVGPYRIIEQLGQGGMATVYKAYHAALDRYVAIKALHPAFGEDPNFLARFQREARLVAKLEHPNIVPVYDYAEHEGRPYLVMKFIEGDTLKARLTSGPLSSSEINKVVESVGSALGYAHQQGVLHRDIKPSNVLLATDGQIYLADFGLARIAQSGESTLSSDMIMGTPQYISPEQAMGKKELDEGTDIYSFGVMLYEMVVGQVPFNADTPFSIIHDHIYSPLPMPRAINPKIPESVERVLLKALAKERADRYPDVATLVTAFKNAWTEAGVPMQGTAITMRPASLKAASTKTADAGATVAAKNVPGKKRSPWPFIAAGVLLLICLAVVVLAFRGGRLRGSNPPASTAPVVLASTPIELASTPVLSTSTVGSPSGPTATVVPAVATALSAASQNPTEPKAALAVSLAYWDAKNYGPAMQFLAKSADLAGASNTQFFQNAGDQFKQRQAWIAAAAMYLRAIKSLGPSGQPQQGLVDNFHEALYNASVSPDITSYLPFADLSRVEQPMSMVAQARYHYYNGNPDQAHSLLNQVMRLKPGMPEATLLQAEMDAKEGKSFQAKQSLNILLSNLNTPDWISQAAQELLNKIP
jgi:serine/threonine protein kinase